MTEEARQRLLVALKNLPTCQRQVLSLSCFEKWPYTKIAEHMGISTDQVEHYLARALATLVGECQS